ncbi:MAG: hypothetical protein ACLTI1_01585 [Clostridia bacterium]
MVAFSGLVGAGRTEVMEAIFGATKITSGKVFLYGEEVHIKNPADAIREKWDWLQRIVAVPDFF